VQKRSLAHHDLRLPWLRLVFIGFPAVFFDFCAPAGLLFLLCDRTSIAQSKGEFNMFSNYLPNDLFLIVSYCSSCWSAFLLDFGVQEELCDLEIRALGEIKLHSPNSPRRQPMKQTSFVRLRNSFYFLELCRGLSAGFSEGFANLSDGQEACPRWVELCSLPSCLLCYLASAMPTRPLATG